MDQSTLVSQLRALGVTRGDIVMVHSSFRSLGFRDPELILQALLETLGEEGTLLMPALSYLQEPANIHNTNRTPTCVGFLSEYFRCRAGTLRSVHPTHSVCGVGAHVHDWLEDHIEDCTPCGPHSPFHKLLHCPGKILMLGCGLEPNTSMHAVEELAPPPYLFAAPMVYTITDADSHTFEKEYIPHLFQNVIQRYDRVGELLTDKTLSKGTVGQAVSCLIRGEVLLEAALPCLRSDPFYFVDQQ